MEELGGARTHNTKSGIAHYMGSDEDDALDYVKALLSFLPQNNLDEPPVYDEPADLEPNDVDLALDSLIPDSPNQPYDMHTVIEAVLDDAGLPRGAAAVRAQHGDRLRPGRGPHASASSPTSRCSFAGTLDIDASEKAARFVRTCDAFNIPVLTFVDVPGFLPGTDQEWNGIIRRGAKLIYAYAEATVPLVTVITRKAYGGAYDVMGSKHLGADVNLAWPTAQIAVMGAQGAVDILYRTELAKDAEDPEAPPRRADRRLRGHAGQPLHRRRAGLRRRGHRPPQDPRRDRPRAAAAAHQARVPAAQEAREHPAVSDPSERPWWRSPARRDHAATRRPRRSPPSSPSFRRRRPAGRRASRSAAAARSPPGPPAPRRTPPPPARPRRLAAQRPAPLTAPRTRPAPDRARRPRPGATSARARPWSRSWSCAAVGRRAAVLVAGSTGPPRPAGPARAGRPGRRATAGRRPPSSRCARRLEAGRPGGRRRPPVGGQHRRPRRPGRRPRRGGRPGARRARERRRWTSSATPPAGWSPGSGCATTAATGWPVACSPSGSPHHGTAVAARPRTPRGCPGACRSSPRTARCCAGSTRGDETPVRPACVSVWSTSDQVVVPPDIARPRRRAGPHRAVGLPRRPAAHGAPARGPGRAGRCSASALGPGPPTAPEDVTCGLSPAGDVLGGEVGPRRPEEHHDVDALQRHARGPGPASRIGSRNRSTNASQ